LFNKNLIGDSVVDESKLDQATPAQLQATVETIRPSVESTPEKVGTGTVQKAFQAPETPMVLLDAPNYQVPSASAANNFESYTSNMMYQQHMLEQNRESVSSGASMSMINAPSSSTQVTNNTNVQSGTIVTKDPTDSMYGNYKYKR
jgi:hypothetical protein